MNFLSKEKELLHRKREKESATSKKRSPQERRRALRRFLYRGKPDRTDSASKGGGDLVFREAPFWKEGKRSRRSPREARSRAEGKESSGKGSSVPVKSVLGKKGASCLKKSVSAKRGDRRETQSSPGKKVLLLGD